MYVVVGVIIDMELKQYSMKFFLVQVRLTWAGSVRAHPGARSAGAASVPDCACRPLSVPESAIRRIAAQGCESLQPGGQGSVRPRRTCFSAPESCTSCPARNYKKKS